MQPEKYDYFSLQSKRISHCFFEKESVQFTESYNIYVTVSKLYVTYNKDNIMSIAS